MWAILTGMFSLLKIPVIFRFSRSEMNGIWGSATPLSVFGGLFGVPQLVKGAIHSTKIPTGPTGKRGPPQKVDPFFRNFSGWTEPIH